MNGRSLADYFISHETKNSSAFRAVLVYEGYLAGRCAMDSYRLLLSEFDGGLEFQTSMWRFDALEGATTFEEAIREAFHADAVILAAYQRELPIRVRQWIDEWVSRRHRQKAAIVAFLRADEDFPALNYLKKTASDAGLDFFATALKFSRGSYIAAERLRGPRLGHQRIIAFILSLRWNARFVIEALASAKKG